MGRMNNECMGSRGGNVGYGGNHIRGKSLSPSNRPGYIDPDDFNKQQNNLPDDENKMEKEQDEEDY